MPVDVVIGAQWGDEGKGKITDLLAKQADVVARFQGGNNAGHTIIIGEQEHKLHILPSGMLSDGTVCVLGNGVVIDPRILLKELEGLKAKGISTDRLRISANAHLIMPYHVALDHAEEDRRTAKDVIGTTRRGVGPCYADKTARLGVRLQDALDPSRLEHRIRVALQPKREMLGDALRRPELQVEVMVQQVLEYARRLEPFITDTTRLIWQALEEGKVVLGEGAQGALLDLDHGTYPFVTSSNCISAAACSGLGVPPQSIRRVIGVAKAYTTRIAAGPFPTEVKGELDDLLVQRGLEFGTTTGRRRRCGWLDLVALKHAVQLNGITELALTKLDVLAGIDQLHVAVAYRDPCTGEVLEYYPCSQALLERVEPVYETLPGFDGSLGKARSFEQLPETARDFVCLVEERAGVPVKLIGVGRSREQIIQR